MNNNLQNSNSVITKKIDWQTIQFVMKGKFAQDIYESWLKKIELVDEFKNYILISVSTRFIRDWITSRYLDQILQIVKKYNKDIIRIEFIVEDNNQAILNNLKDMITNEPNRAMKRKLIEQYEILAPLTGSAFDAALEDLSLTGSSVDDSNNDDKPVVQFQSSTTPSRIRPVVAPVTSNPVS